jgi:spermidine/putrescine-binding protein
MEKMMIENERRISRGELLKVGATGMLGLTLAGPALAAAARRGNVTLNWLTWQDHYLGKQVDAVKAATGIAARPTLFSDNADAFIKVKVSGAQWDIVSADALWVPKYLKYGLIEPFDINSIPVAKQLYPIAREFPFWKTGSNYMGYPVGWSPQPLYYNPKFTKKPTRWDALLDKRLAKKIVLVNAPTDMMAVGGIATKAKQPYNMTTAEIGRAKAWLKALKPNVQKLAAQSDEAVRALADESAWIAMNNLGTEYRVKAAGGPTVNVAFPVEGAVGFIDAEMMVKKSKHRDSFLTFINAAEDASWVAKNFLENGRPLFNAKAYKMLVNTGNKERADRLLYNKPELALKMVLKGPSQNQQAYIDAFNEVFGA